MERRHLCAGYSCSNATRCCNMIVFYHQHIIKANPMINSPSNQNSPFVKSPETRSGLPGVKDANTGALRIQAGCYRSSCILKHLGHGGAVKVPHLDGSDHGRSCCCYTAHALHQVQCNALRRQDCNGAAMNAAKVRALADMLAIFNRPCHRQLFMHQVEHLRTAEVWLGAPSAREGWETGNECNSGSPALLRPARQ